MPTSGSNIPPDAPSPAPKKPKFSIQELTAINAALKANPATKNLAERVINALNDPGVSPPPMN
jgi:hypothetical protein